MDADREKVIQNLAKHDLYIEKQDYDGLNDFIFSLDCNDVNGRETLIAIMAAALPGECVERILYIFYRSKLNQSLMDSVDLLIIIMITYRLLQLNELGLQLADRLIELGEDDEFCYSYKIKFLYQLGRFEDCIEVASQLLIKHPEWGYLHSIQIAAYIATGQLEQAKKEYSALEERDPEKVKDIQHLVQDWSTRKYEAYRTQLKSEAKKYIIEAFDHSRHDDLHSALTNYVEALNCDPENVSALTSYGVILDKLNFHEEGFSMHHRAIKIDPSFAPAFHNLHQYNLKIKKDVKLAISSLEIAIQLDPEYIQAYNALGVIYDDEYKDYETGLKYFSKSLEVDSHYDKTWGLTGYCLEQLGRHEEAINAYQMALKINPESGSRLNLINLFIQLKQYESAKRLIITLLEEEPDDFGMVCRFGIILGEQGDIYGAKKTMDKLSDLEPQCLDDHFRKAWLLEFVNQDEAVDIYSFLMSLPAKVKASYSGYGEIEARYNNLLGTVN